MVSVSKEGHLLKHCTVEMGVALTLIHTLGIIIPSLQV